MKTSRMWPVYFVVAALLATVGAPAQTRKATLPQETWTAITEAARDYREANRVPGMAVAVGVRGQLVYSQGFGIATPRPDYVDGTTVFRLASVSKPVTAILAMMLEDHGKLDINKQTRSYLPELSPRQTHRLRHILTHTSGVRHYIDNDPASAQNEWFNRMTDAAKLFSNDGLLFTPGQNVAYSTHAFTLLGAAMERATGRDFHQLMERQLSAPMGLHSLKVENRSQPVPNRKRSQLFTSNHTLIKNPDNISWKAPGGGLEASANDLCRLGMNLVDGKVLKPATLRRMFTKQRLDDHNQTVGDYGLGWRLATHLGQTVAGHSGSQTGAASYWRIYPDSKVVVVVLTNARQNEPRSLAVKISEIVIK